MESIAVRNLQNPTQSSVFSTDRRLSNEGLRESTSMHQQMELAVDFLISTQNWFNIHSVSSSTESLIPPLAQKQNWTDINTDTNIFRNEKAFKDLLGKFPFPLEWRQQGVAEPKPECEKKALRFFSYLKQHLGLNPRRIAPSIEEGILLYYVHSKSTERTMSIEIFNEDLDVVCVVSDGKKVLYSEYVNSFIELAYPMALFKNES